MNDKQHIPEEVFLAFAQERLKPDELNEFLAHISSCDYCAGRLEACMAQAMLPAPRGLKESILSAAARSEVRLAVKARETSKRMQLFVYSLKVGTAAIAALLMLLFTMNPSLLPGLPQLQPDPGISAEDEKKPREFFSLSGELRDSMYQLSDSMLDFSNKIIHMEVIEHDKKEK